MISWCLAAQGHICNELLITGISTFFKRQCFAGAVFCMVAIGDCHHDKAWVERQMQHS
jgi:hypothetical protein